MAKKSKSTKKAKTTKTAKKKSARKPSAAFMRPVSPSPALAEIIGSKAVPRTEVTKRLWAYIKKNKLQDAKNKRMINADATLKAVFGGTDARSVLGIPEGQNLKIKPGNHGNFDIFVQSTSLNRKLVRGTKLLVKTN